MKNFILFLFIELLLCQYIFADVFSKAKVLKIGSSEIKKNVKIENVSLEIISGKHKNKIVDVKNYLWDEKNYNTQIKQNSVVVVAIAENECGEIENVFIRGYVRDKFLLLTVLIFFAVLCSVCGWKGARAFASIFLNIFLLVKVLIPLIKDGYSPLISCSAVALIGAIITIFLIFGFTKKSFVSLCGITAGILFAGITTLIFLKLSKISGIFLEGSRMIITMVRTSDSWKITDFASLIAGGTVIASLGAVIDVVVDVVSGMNSVSISNPDIKKSDLISSGLEIGRDVLGGMLGSLLFVFVSTSLVMIVVYTVLHVPFIRIINWEFFSIVVIQAFISSLAFVVSIPPTVYLMGFISKN
ncbi:MAG: YibE/F family protein [Elusimicrobiota bacterium]